MTAVLVTGSSGFLGRSIARALLRRGVKVIGIDPQPCVDDAFQVLSGNLDGRHRIADYLTHHNVTHVIHCGGISAPHLASAEHIVNVNVRSSLDLFLTSLAHGVRRIVYCSSTAVTGPARGPQPAGNLITFDPRNAYACSKAAVEYMIRGLCDPSLSSFCTIRFPAIYGPGRQTQMLLHELVVAAVDRRSYSVPDLSAAPYIYVDDAAEAAIAACFSDTLSTQTYYAAYPEYLTPLQLAETIREFVPTFAFETPNVSETDRPASFDISLATSDFGFFPTIDHRTGIQNLIRSLSFSPMPGVS